MAELINRTDNLNQGREKLNKAIGQAEESLNKSIDADTKATEALSNSESTQEQLDTVVIEGDSSVEAAQARVNADNTKTYATLKERLDQENKEVKIVLAEKANKERLEDILINVKDFGAIGDGITDDSIAIQTAIDSVESGSIFFPFGQYVISATIILKNNIHLVGVNSSGADSSGTTILFKGDSPYAISLTGETSRENVHIKNLGVINKSGNMSDGIYLNRFTTQCMIENVAIKGFKNNLVIERAWYCTINNLDVSYGKEENIILRRANGITLSNIRSRYATISGLAITNDCNNLVIIGGAFEGCTHGIKIMNGKNININTYFEGNKTHDIYCTEQSGANGKSVNIYNCFFNPVTDSNATTQQYAIYFENVNVGSVKGCYFADRGVAATRVGSKSSDIYIENNFYVEPSKVITDAGTNTRLNEPQVFNDINLGRLLTDLNGNSRSITNLHRLNGRSDRALDISGGGQDIRLNFNNKKATGFYYGTGRIAYFENSDLYFEANGRGIVIKDKTTGLPYRVIVNNGVLDIESI